MTNSKTEEKGAMREKKKRISNSVTKLTFKTLKQKKKWESILRRNEKKIFGNLELFRDYYE